MDRLTRLLDLVHVLRESREPLSLEQIRGQFADYRGANEQSTRRKFERDKAELTKLGLALRYVDEDGVEGYVLDAEESFLPDVGLESHEYALLGAAARAALGDASFPFPVALRLALAKLDTDQGDEADASFRLTTLSGRDTPPRRGILEALSDALVRRKRVHLRYRRPTEERTTARDAASHDFVVSERDVDPYGITLRRGAWYLIGHDHLSGQIRVFRTSRVTELVVNPAKPGQADFTLPADFELSDFLSSSPHGYPVHASESVVVEVEADVAFMMERRWGAPVERSGSGAAGAPDSGSVALRRFEFESSNLDYVVDQVLALGKRATLLEPPRGRAMLRDAYAAILAVHQAQSGLGSGPSGPDSGPSGQAEGS